jgi:hypothetical protein
MFGPVDMQIAAGGFGVGQLKRDHLRPGDGWFAAAVLAPGGLFTGARVQVGESWCLLLAAGLARCLR